MSKIKPKMPPRSGRIVFRGRYSGWLSRCERCGWMGSRWLHWRNALDEVLGHAEHDCHPTEAP